MNWSYVAGFFDGEGSIVRIKNAKCCYRITIGQKHPVVLECIAKFLRKEGLRSHIYFTRNQAGIVVLGFANAEAVQLFLRGVLPFLIVKKDLGQQVLDAYQQFQPKRRSSPSSQDHAFVKKLIRQGLSNYKICQVVGISHGHGILKRLREEALG